MGRGSGSVWITLTSLPQAFWGPVLLCLSGSSLINSPAPHCPLSLILFGSDPDLNDLSSYSFYRLCMDDAFEAPGELRDSLFPLSLSSVLILIVAGSEEVTCLLYISGRPTAALAFPKEL